MKRTAVLIELIIVATVSGLILLPVVHELGHYIIGVSMGSEVNYIKLLPPRPHVSFRSTSSDALPWINAGGLIFPSIAGTCFAIAWLVLRKGANVHVRLLFWLPAIILLSGNFGLFIEVTKKKDMNYHHLLFLGEHFGLSGSALVAFQITPAIMSLGIILFLIAIPRIKAKSAQQGSQSDVVNCAP